MAGLQSGRRRVFLVRFPTTARDLFPPESVQNGTVAQRVTHSMYNKYLSPWSEPEHSPHIMPSLRMSGALQPIPRYS